MNTNTYVIFYQDTNGDNFEAWVDAKTVSEAVEKSKVNPRMITTVAVDTEWTYQTDLDKRRTIYNALELLGYKVTDTKEVRLIDIDPDRSIVYFHGISIGIWDFVKKTFVD